MDQGMIALLRERPFCALATCASGLPHCSLMSFAFDEKLMEVYLATLTTTRKFANLSANPRVSLLVDDRDSSGRSPEAGRALTISGRIEPFESSELAGRARAALLSRHPELSAILANPSSAIIRVRIESLQLLDGLLRSSTADVASNRGGPG